MPGTWSEEVVEALVSGARAEEVEGLELCFLDWAMCSDLEKGVRLEIEREVEADYLERRSTMCLML